MKTSTKFLSIALMFCGLGAIAQAPVVNFSWTPASPCAGATVAITGSITSGTVTVWGYSLTGATSPSYTVQNPVATFTAAGTQTITLIALNGVTPSAPVVQTITVKAAPTITAASSQSTAACPGTTANLTANGGTAYVWTAPATGSTAVTTVTLPGATYVYSVVGTGTNGCTSTGTVQQLVTVKPVTVTSSAAGSVICTGETHTLTATAAQASYSWAPVTSTVNTAAISPTVAGSASYTVWTTSTVTCPGYTWSTVFTVSVSACVGIQQNANQAVSFGVYPNPTSGEFTIELANGTDKTIEVIDFTGKIVLVNTTSNDKINMNLSTLAKGIYYVRVQSNNTVEVAKMIKE